MTEFNHMHYQDGDDWVCGRALAFEDKELVHCEARDLEDDEACGKCAQQLLGYFGRAAYLQ